MEHLSRERGSALILVIAVVATLAILAASLTFVVVNVSSNTARDRGRAKAFHVAEGGLDAAQNMLLGLWPTSPETVPVFRTNTFRGQFDLADFPNPPSGTDFIDIRVGDDVNAAIPYDNGNNILVIDSTAHVGKASARVQVEVQRIPETFPDMPSGIAAYSDGLLKLNGTGSAEPFQAVPPGTTANVITQDTLNDPDLTKDGWTVNGGLTFPPANGLITAGPNPTYRTADDVFSSELRQRLVELADKYGNRVDASSMNQTLWLSLWLRAFTEYPHVVAIRSGDVKITTSDVPTTGWTSPAGDKKWMFGPGPIDPLPGILIVENGTATFDGNLKFHGLVYAKKGIEVTGEAEIDGMVVTEGTITVSGTRSIVYNAYIFDNLHKLIPASVRIIPGTWRELSPTE